MKEFPAVQKLEKSENIEYFWDFGLKSARNKSNSAKIGFDNSCYNN